MKHTQKTTIKKHRYRAGISTVVLAVMLIAGLVHNQTFAIDTNLVQTIFAQSGAGNTPPNSDIAQNSNGTQTDNAADEDTDAATSSATTEKLRERIEKIVDEKRDQIRGVIDEFAEQRRGTIGQVTRLSEESITITTKKTTEIIPVDDTVTLLKDGSEIEIDEVAVDDWLVVMGVIIDDAFQPVRILVSSDSLRPDTPIVELGTITTIERGEFTISPRDQSDEFTIEITSSTEYQDIEGTEIELTDITEEMQALIVGFENEDNERTATLIRILTVADLEPESEE